MAKTKILKFIFIVKLKLFLLRLRDKMNMYLHLSEKTI